MRETAIVKTISMPDSLWDAVEEYSDAHHMSRSEVFRAIVREYFGLEGKYVTSTADNPTSKT